MVLGPVAVAVTSMISWLPTGPIITMSLTAIALRGSALTAMDVASLARVPPTLMLMAVSLRLLPPQSISSPLELRPLAMYFMRAPVVMMVLTTQLAPVTGLYM